MQPSWFAAGAESSATTAPRVKTAARTRGLLDDQVLNRATTPAVRSPYLREPQRSSDSVATLTTPRSTG